MGIQDRINDAQLLWEHEHHEGALLNVLVAVAASARKQYPKLKDRESFVAFLEPEIVKISRISMAGIAFRDKMWTPAELFYKWFRCQLVHEGELPIDAQFVDKGSALFVQAGGDPGPPLQISYAWFWVLVRAVTEATINKELFEPPKAGA